LYYRLNVVAIALPPLRERREDIAPLARHFAADMARRLGRALELSPDAVRWLEQQPWRGNIRELEHAIERAGVLSDKHVLDSTDLAAKFPLSALAERGPGGEDLSGERGAGSGKLKDQINSAEKRAIQAALDAADGNRAAAAKRLGVSLRTLFYKMVRHRMG
jgi:DNA-binding NtrC family response regulator